jgi:hypothetical protein
LLKRLLSSTYSRKGVKRRGSQVCAKGLHYAMGATKSLGTTHVRVRRRL